MVIKLSYIITRIWNLFQVVKRKRIRLASQIGSGLTGVLYVLDEPSIGLHQRDNKKLITAPKN